MRFSVLAIGLVACGDNTAARDAAPGRDAIAIDAMTIDTPTDAPVLPACANPTPGTHLRFRLIGQVEGHAVLVTAPRGDRRLFVVERAGRIRIVDEDEQLRPTPFLDLTDAITAISAEQGLLGLAFHPEYAANGELYVFYTRRANPDTDPVHRNRDVLARCHRSAGDPDRAEPTCEEILVIPDFASNHNGGMIEFGPDGYLYLGTGDGGSSGDPRNNAQTLVDGTGNANSIALLGKLLRIDVDRRDPGKAYAAPPDNPFVASGGAPEIYALGLRNPWRWSFDRATGDIWIGDVGEQNIEELNYVRAGELAGKNFGWHMWEGRTCFRAPCTTDGMTFPQAEHRHADGWQAVIGGQVYRGTCYPDLVGTYLYGNFGIAAVTAARAQPDGSIVETTITPRPGEPKYPGGFSSLHEDARGELWLTTTNVAGGGGGIFHVEAVP